MKYTNMTKAELKNINSILNAVRSVNKLIIRENDKSDLIKKTCELFAQSSGFLSAWIVLVDTDGNYMDFAHAGLGKSSKELKEKLRSGEPIHCFNQALSQNRLTVIEDPGTNCIDCPLNKKYKGLGGLAIPLVHKGKLYGLLMMSMEKKYISDEERLRIFQETADDLAFALYNIGLKEEHKTHQKNEHSKIRYRHVVEDLPGLICCFLPDTTITFVNKNYCEYFGKKNLNFLEQAF